MKLSACGLLCDECQYMNKECDGCFQTNGKPFWASGATTTGICLLYDCSVNRKRYRNCGECAELPCKSFLELKDPAITDEEHQKSIQKRVAILCGQ